MSRLTYCSACLVAALYAPGPLAAAPAVTAATQTGAAARTFADTQRDASHATQTRQAIQPGTGDDPPSAQLRAASAAQTKPVTLTPIEVRGAQTTSIIAQQRLTPGAVSVVDADTFRQRSVTNMADALRYVPGVLMESNTGGSDGILSIRGSNLTALNYDKGGVTLLQDGLPVSSADGANHNRLLDPATARNVIVAQGTNALAYGASDLGGAIDFISRTARNSDPRQLTLRGGSYGLVDGALGTGGISGDFDGMLTLEGSHFGGYRQHSREDIVSAFGNFGWQPAGNFNLRTYATYVNDRQQLAGSLTRAEFDANPRQGDPSYVLGNHQVNVKTGRLATKGTWIIDADHWLEFGVSYEVQSLYHPIVDVYDFSIDPPPDYFSLLIDTVQRTAGGMLRYHWTIGDHNVVAGVNLAYTIDRGGNYQNEHGQRGTRTDDVYQRAGNATLFALDRWGFAPSWTLVYGAQGVTTNRNVRDVSLAYGSLRDQRGSYSSINPRVGLIRALGSDSEVFANASRVYEPPNNFELDNDVHKDDTIQHATQGTSFEIGTRGAMVPAIGTTRWHWSLDLYYAKIRNEILSVEDPTEPGNILSTNYPRTIHAGVEALVGASFPIAGDANRIEPLVSFGWNDFRFEDDPTFGNNRLPVAPRFVLHGEVMFRNTASGFYAGPTFEVAGSRHADMANSYRVGGYGLIGLRAGVQRNRWELYVEARNLTDRHYVNTVTALTQAGADARVLNAGGPRSLFAGFTLHY